MSSSLKMLVMALALLAGSQSYAQKAHTYTDDFYEISSVTIEEVSIDVLGMERKEEIHTQHLKGAKYNNPVENLGRVIALGKDIVALGESVYQLVLKGKPVVKTSYAPISVIPREGNGSVDIFATEGWTAPIKRTYQIKYNNLYGVTVVHFMFSVMYSYNGSYNGAGAYLTAVQVVPEYVKSLWGWDFTATMKLGGVQNMGTKANPVAGATIMIEYTANSILENVQRTTSFFITGKGTFKFL